MLGNNFVSRLYKWNNNTYVIYPLFAFDIVIVKLPSLAYKV